MNKNKVIQGQTLGITIALDEPADGELALGIYGQNVADKILLRTEDGTLHRADSTHCVATIPHTRTRELRPGGYTAELLYRTADGEYVSISEKVDLTVVPSKIGKEAEL